MEDLIIQTFSFIDKVMFSPLVLIGLLITSLSLVLNLKDDNKYIKEFKQGKNSKKFISIIFQTICTLLIMFLLTLLSFYMPLPENFTISILIWYGLISLLYILITLYVVINLYRISFILKSIVFTSLLDE